MERYVGDIGTLIGAEKLVVAEGKAKGVTLIRMYNGKLQLLLEADRGLNIYRFDYKGTTLNFISKNGLVSPRQLSPAIDFLNCFEGGFLYTCGLDNFGSPARYADKKTVQHGSMAYLSAENINIFTGKENGEYYVCVQGEVKYTALFGSKLVLRRTIKTYYNSSKVVLEDRIKNESFVTDGYMLLYHINLGYPLLNAQTTVQLYHAEKTECMTELAEKHFDKRLQMEEPTPACPEEVFIYKMRDESGKAVINGKEFSLSIAFNLPYLMEWKSMASGDYALGVEPATSSLKERKKQTIAPGEEHSYCLTFEVSE